MEKKTGKTTLVSIIVPNYNGAQYISKTIESVLSQVYENWELIIIDDCSTDQSISIINSYKQKDHRIKLLVLEKNSGMPAVPRNKGLAIATGEFVAFLDSDDIWHPQKLALQLNYMEKNGLQFSSTDLFRFKEESEITDIIDEKFDNKPFKSLFISHSRLIKKNIIPNSSVVAKRSLFENVQFLEDIRYRAVEDYHCWLRVHQDSIVKSGKIKLPLLLYRLADTSISKSKVPMVKKVSMLLSEYSYKGKSLGFKKYYYFLTYVMFSLWDRI